MSPQAAHVSTAPTGVEHLIRGRCPFCRKDESFSASHTGMHERNCSHCGHSILVVIRNAECGVYRGNIEKLLECIANSELIPANLLEEIARTRDEWQTARGLVDRLLREKLLTHWQCGKLLDERYKGFFVGGYRITEPVAESIYAAQESTGKLVRLLVAGRSSEELQEEQASASRATHPNLLPCHFGIEPPNLIYLAFETGPGESLEEHVRDKGTLSEREAVSLVLSLCDAVELLEKHDVRRLRLIPDHVFLFPDAAPRLLAVAREEPGLTIDGPNDFEGSRVHALGCLLSFALTGTPVTWTNCARSRLREADGNLSPRLVDLTCAMMEYSNSFDSVAEAAKQLRALKGLGDKTFDATTGPRNPKRPRGAWKQDSLHPRGLVVLIPLLLGLLAAGWLIFAAVR